MCNKCSDTIITKIEISFGTFPCLNQVKKVVEFLLVFYSKFSFECFYNFMNVRINS